MTEKALADFIQDVRQLISDDDLELAIDRLLNYTAGSAPGLYDEMITQSGRLKRLARQARQGLLTTGQAEVQRNQLRAALLGVMEELPSKVAQAMAPPPSPEPAGPMTMPVEVGLEKIIGANNLKQIYWLQQGLAAARSVCRVLTPKWTGTGFLVAPDLLMTNHHVLPDPELAAVSAIEFDYQLDLDQRTQPTCRYALDAGRFHNNKALDYAFVGVQVDPSKPDLANWGHLRLNAQADPVPGEHVTIIQHPNGGPKQIALTANQVVGTWEHLLHYTTDTEPGSSGAPVFNDAWQVIAIHHAGGDLQVNAKGERRYVNEGVLMSAIKANAGEWWPG